MLEDPISYKEAAPVLCTRVSCQLHSVTESSLVSRTKEGAGLSDLYLDFAVNDVLLALWPLLHFAESPVQQTSKNHKSSWGGVKSACHPNEFWSLREGCSQSFSETVAVKSLKLTLSTQSTLGWN